MLGAVKFIQEYPLSSGSNETLSGEIVYSHSGAPEDIVTDKFSTTLFGFSYYPRFVYVNQMISLISIIILSDSNIIDLSNFRRKITNLL